MKQRGYVASYLLFFMLMVMAAVASVKVMSATGESEKRKSVDYWKSVYMLSSSASQFYRATCRLGLVTVNELSDAGLLTHPGSFGTIDGLKIEILQPASVPYVAITSDYDPAHHASFTDVLAHGGVVEAAKVVYRKGVAQRLSAVQRRIAAEQDFYAAHTC